MCISCEIHDKWPPFIEFVIWFLLQGLCVGNHFGVWILTKSHALDLAADLYKNVTSEVLNVTKASVTPLINKSINATLLNVNNATFLTINQTINHTKLVLDKTGLEQFQKLVDYRLILLAVCGLGAGLFFIHFLILLPNIVQSCRSEDPLSLKETGGVYFQRLLIIHSLMLILETICFDIPVGCVTMEALALIWDGPLTEDQKLDVSKMIIALSLIGLAFIALYKGMMPLFLWIGNPFCFPCVPLRLLVVFPGGLVALVMTFSPMMGVAKNGLLKNAPASMQAQLADLANAFFSIGMIFWGVFAVIFLFSGCCWYKFCREGADTDICNICC